MHVDIETTDDDETADEMHPVEYLAHTVSDDLNRLGFENDLIGLTTDSALPGYGLSIPEPSELVWNIIENGILPFSLPDPRETSEGEGSHQVTAIHVNIGNTVTETLETLGDAGQLKSAYDLFENNREESDPSAGDLLAYTLFTYSKGWLAEVIITNNERFSKLWVTNDEAGQDARDEETGEEVQIKPVTVIGSNSTKKFVNKNIPHVMYQWHRDGLMAARAEHANDMNKEVAKKDGIKSATGIKKSYDGGKTGETSALDRPARLLWW